MTSYTEPTVQRSPRQSRPRRSLVIGLVGFVIVLILASAALAIGLLFRGDGVATEPSPSPSISPAAETREPTPSPDSTAEPTSRPTPSPPASSIPIPQQPMAWDSVPSGWTEVASFDSPEDGFIQVIGLRAWSGGFIAIGLAQRFDESGEVREPRIWVSADGMEWTEVGVDLGSTDVELTSLSVTENGEAVVVGRVGRRGNGDDLPAAWRSSDGATWTPLALPSEIDVHSEASAVSGPHGHLVTDLSAVWYSDDLETWERVLVADEDAWVSSFDAGDEGFVASAGTVYASGDGRNWYEADTWQNLFEITAVRGDWYAWTYTDSPSTISVLRSANGLHWAPVVDVNDLTPADGPKAGRGMESEITKALVASADHVLVLTLGFNHCCLQPDLGVASFASVDGANWERTQLPGSAVVTSLASNGDALVAGGAVDRGERAVFWVAER
jgi:hypothetical protein